MDKSGIYPYRIYPRLSLECIVLEFIQMEFIGPDGSARTPWDCAGTPASSCGILGEKPPEH